VFTSVDTVAIGGFEIRRVRGASARSVPAGTGGRCRPRL